MTVQQAQIDIAKTHGLTNVEGLAAACDHYRFPFWMACTILDKETDGRNIFGHDRGGAMSGPSSLNIEVTEDLYRQFKALISPPKNQTSNGVGPMQLTWPGYFLGKDSIESRGLAPWDPADNMLYGVSILAGNWKANGGDVYKTAKAYNGAAAYGLAAVPLGKTWKTRVGTADLGAVPVPPAPEPVGEIRHSKTWNADYRGWKPIPGGDPMGEGWVTVEDWEILTIIDAVSMPWWKGLHLTQGGRSTSEPASKGTHAGLGAFDVRTKYNTRAEVWQLATVFLQCGLVFFPRGYNLGSWNPFKDTKHGHVTSGVSYDSMSKVAQDQYDEYLRHGDGLIGSAKYTGPSTKLVRWPDSIYNPAASRVASAPLLAAWAARQGKPLPKASPDVKVVQRALNRKLGSNLAVDGDPGPATKAVYTKVDPDGMPDDTSLKDLGLEVLP